nr:uncharacterized protein LOC123766150 [Procambarus clarkii]
MEVWNRREVVRPPSCTLRYTSKERQRENFDMCVQALLEGILCGHAVLCDKEVSWSFLREVAILTTSLFQNGRHRTEKFYKALKKVEKCSERWKEFNLGEILVDLRQLMPAIPPTHKCVRMPSKQMFDYLLIKILGGFHLLLGLDGYCREAAGYLVSKISSGHFFSTAMAFLANVARIRALALDLSGQLAKVYDDIFPWIEHLKSSSTPCLAIKGSLPSKLSDSLQQYSSSLDENSNSMLTEDTPKVMNFSHKLNIFKKEDKNVDTNFCCYELSESKDDLRKATQSERFLNKEVKLAENVKVPAPLECLEDIGVCINDDNQIMKRSSNVNNNASKRKKVTDSSGMCKPGMMVVRCNNSGTDNFLNVGVEKNSSKLKRKREAVDPANNKKNKTNIGPHCKLNMEDNNITPTFFRHYLSVNKKIKKINCIEDMSSFLKQEKERRCKKDSNRISILLREEDWIMMVKSMKSKLKKNEELRESVSASNGNLDVNTLMKKVKIRLKFWLLFPELKGEKPENWKSMLCDIKNGTNN